MKDHFKILLGRFYEPVGYEGLARLVTSEGFSTFSEPEWPKRKLRMMRPLTLAAIVGLNAAFE